MIVVGASAGGVEALQAFAGGLPADLDAAVLVVLHVPRGASSALPAILSRSGPLPARHAADGDPLVRGQILVAPADHHLLVLDNRVRLSRGPSENGHRPAVDPSFRTVARAWGCRTIAVVLSGARDDGTSGALVVGQCGGTVIVQDPEEALHGSMPRSVCTHVPQAQILPVSAMAQALVDTVSKLTATGSSGVARSLTSGESDLLTFETAMAGMADITTDETNATPSALGCPSCHGELFELPGEPAPRFRCRVGHAWSAASLLDEQAAAMEGALWMALRSLEEKSSLSRRMADAARERGSRFAAERFDRASAESFQAGQLIRNLIQRIGETGDLSDPVGTG